MRAPRPRTFAGLRALTLPLMLALLPTHPAAAGNPPAVPPEVMQAVRAMAASPQAQIGILGSAHAGGPGPRPPVLPARPDQVADIGSGAGFAFESDTVSRRLGLRVIPAGDVNGDGFSDFVASAGSFTATGPLYLFLGGPNGPALAPGFPVETVDASPGLAPAGDVDGDGYDDIIAFWPGSGRVRVFRGTATGLDTDNPYALDFGLNQIGLTAGPAGDLNGDGKADIIVGLPNSNGVFPCGVSPKSGVAEVFFGSASGVTMANNWVVAGCQLTGDNALLGSVVIGVGDVNGDGFDDVAISAPGATAPLNTGPVVGKVYVFLGSASGLPVQPGFSNLGTVADAITITGHHTSSGFGDSVAPAGDLNGDGFADIAIGAPADGTYGSNSGMAFVYPGNGAGVDTAQAHVLWSESSGVVNAEMGITLSAAGDLNGDARPDLLVGEVSRVDIAQSTGSTLIISQTLPFAYSSSSVMTAGDVNGDGFSDIVVGDPSFTNGQSAEGRVLVYFGTGSPPSGSATWTATQVVENSPNLGWTVASAGDVNGDGFDDVIVGAPNMFNWTLSGQANNGLVLLFYGHPSGLSTLSDWSFFGASGDELGYSVSAGDVNGDGYSDLIIGAPFAAGGLGQVRIWYGSSSGPSGLASSVTLTGATAGSQFGAAVACAGDVNGDGYPDVVVGAPYGVDPVTPRANEGRAYLYYGGAGGVNTTPFWSESGGQADAHFGAAVAAAGDVNGDSWGDVVIGGPDYDNFVVFETVVNAGRVFVEYGGPSGVASEQFTRSGSASRFGASVACAGDVNGDGYSDIIVGGPTAKNTLANEGVAQVLPGGPSGFGAALWTQYGGESGAAFGTSVSSAGDVDGDGLSDVLVGAPLADAGGPADQGKVSLYRGPLTAGAAPIWTASGGSASDNLGQSVACAGDVNGDGWPDVLAGMPGWTNSFTRQGLALLYPGARGLALRATSEAVQFDGLVHFIQPGCLTDDGEMMLAADLRSAAGRARVRMQYRMTGPVKLFAPVVQGFTAPTLTGPPGTFGSEASVEQFVAPLVSGVPYAWSLRTLAHNVWYPTGPWRQPARSGRRETDVRVPGQWLAVPHDSPVATLELADVHPNPTHADATVSFSLSRPGPVSLEVLDVQGRRVRTLAKGTLAAGPHDIAWDGRTADGSHAGVGVYLVRLAAEGRVLTRKTVLVR